MGRTDRPGTPKTPRGSGTARLPLILALALGCAALIPVVSGATGPALRLPPDRVYGTQDGSPGPVTFSHATHWDYASHSCIACHPQPFHMLRPTGRTSHDEMNAGRSCGLCHNGAKAFGVQDSDACEVCHAARGGER
ncbi:MAG TPA: c(7)-type cytochrome triheme domain-containing protein [Candidatus Polarisedimenticolia bacterium]|nr:c(7)-type cytochrome triheme domain-containing protein [Candidatus Polarisedimenticolia bacterium]